MLPESGVMAAYDKDAQAHPLYDVSKDPRFGTLADIFAQSGRKSRAAHRKISGLIRWNAYEAFPLPVGRAVDGTKLYVRIEVIEWLNTVEKRQGGQDNTLAQQFIRKSGRRAV
jgi:hypothetical protein